MEEKEALKKIAEIVYFNDGTGTDEPEQKLEAIQKILEDL